MALPHMPSQYTTRKNIYEAAIVRRRTQEDDLREKWSENAKYFNSTDIHSHRDASWSSKATFQSSMDAYKKSYEKDTKMINLAARRSRLSSLLQNERNQYEAELKGYSLDNYQRMEQMKERSDSLKSAREEERQQVAQVKLYEHFRRNSPDLRKIQSEQMANHVIEKWTDQIEEKQAAQEQERLEKEQYEAEQELKRQKALDRQQELDRERRANELRFKEILKEQMLELKTREEEAALMKKQQDVLLKRQWELDQIEEQRRLNENEQKKQEFGRVLLKQHAAHMRRKARIIMEELEQDKRVLESLIEQQETEVALQTARKEKARADAEWMKQVIEDQLRLEREREAELNMLYQDEAAKVWSQREHEWKREREARQRLMDDVLAGRKEQISVKMEELQRKQAESLQRREELIRDMERANQMTRREKEAEEHTKQVQRDELGAQITERMEQRERSVMDEIAQLELEQRAEEDYEELLRQEAERLRLEGYQPEIHTRRGKQAWQ